MGNNNACKTVGIGNIRMKMFDERALTIKDVRHVLDLRKNLLSLGALKAQGYKFSGMNGVLKVTKSFMTVLKVKCMSDLYKVIESVANSDASVATEKEDTARL